MSRSTLDLDRRGFLKAGAAGTLAAAVGGRTLLERGGAQDDAAGDDGPPYTGEELVKTVCTHCSVGCGLKMAVEDDTIVGQEAWEDNPINQGGLCSKGSSLTQTENSEQRLKEPMKLEDGDWVRMDWDEILDEICGRLNDIHEETGPHATMWVGSACHSNEAAYLIRKLASLYGTNNIDHQARICHSTTVTGIANTWGVGAMTNNSNDMRNVDVNLIIGHNPIESHPVAWQHFQVAQQRGGKHIVAEPRYTETAAAADGFYQFRSGTDVAFIYGLLYHIVFNLDAHDEAFIDSRVMDWAEFRDDVLVDYDLETVSDICGTSESDLMELAEELADADVSCVEWAMGGTQHNNANGNVRAYAMLNLALGHAAQSAGGTPIFRGHDNVQGATDLGVDSSTLPGYYGLDESAWRHWASVWSETESTPGEISYEEVRERFHSRELMEKDGFTVARWFEGVLDDEWEIYQPDPLQAAIFWGHGLASLSEYGKVREAVNELDFIVNIDIFPNQVAELAEMDTDAYLLPAATNLEEAGSATNTGRQIQWRSQAATPRHNARKDWELMCEFGERLGLGEHFDYDEVEDVTREWNLGTRSVGYVGQTPERLKAHQENADLFSVEDLQAEVDEAHEFHGEYYGLPWPCWHEDHPGTPILYDASKPPSEGGMDFRARWWGSPDDNWQLRDSYEPEWWDGEIEGVPQYPGFATVLPESGNPAAKTLPMEYAEREDTSVLDTAEALAERGHDIDVSDYEDFDNPQPDSPWGRGRARMKAWNLTDEYPVHREPAVSPRPDLVEEYPCNDRVEDHWRVELDNYQVQQDNIDAVEDYDLVLTSGRQVEHTGAGAKTRSTLGTASRAPMMYLEIHPTVADELGVEEGDWIVTETPHAEMMVQARPSERVAPDHAFAPFHWSGILEGEKVTGNVPDGLEPLVIGETINAGTAPAYDVETQMQETKTTLCSVRTADDDEIPELSQTQLDWQEQRMNRHKR
ncbi:probable anaerobic dehydrogenase alpha subunit [Natronomonas pharaonis DSM 2160]|uniref:Probable anaerobic dehydrogenase alpha subunit n=1 Tax=Natronomonas pharaonis (strain ATCC 35678 / DSM 2160 / CIP 103997 / JCM 8858 / NBRC 14720 / NCIMB 2260 / Gabara) TaxID=348780 RepID=A0A1U7EZ55_NATPD|nr:molybdopterin-dependent oxidoreductase [Natronomonas pharaonis]CAI50572.1 probable anaerobic dehydrogenase alpha subunit [Natronomonas pharaonis DSM 2160]